MSDEMVMRSVYLRPAEDSQLRQLAHDLNVTKSDLIRSAISVKLHDWLGSNSKELVLQDLTFGRHENATDRATRAAAAKVVRGNPIAKPAETKKPAPQLARKKKQETAQKKLAPARARQFVLA